MARRSRVHQSGDAQIAVGRAAIVVAHGAVVAR
jgi:hypothetical protein